VIAGSAARKVQPYPEDPERVTAEGTHHRRSALLSGDDRIGECLSTASQFGEGSGFRTRKAGTPVSPRFPGPGAMQVGGLTRPLPDSRVQKAQGVNLCAKPANNATLPVEIAVSPTPNYDHPLRESPGAGSLEQETPGAPRSEWAERAGALGPLDGARA
jgi:hypothetical protein